MNLFKTLLLASVSIAPLQISATTGSLTLFEQGTYRQLKSDPLLNPNQEILTFPKATNTIYGIVDFRSDLSPEWRYQIRYRPILESTRSESSFSGVLDEAFIEWKSDQNFFYAGKKNNKDGVGLSANPTDFFGENKRVDKTKREEDRRIQREGDLLLGADFFQDNWSYSLIFSPKSETVLDNRYLVKANILLESLRTDLSALYFSGPLSGIGINLSTTVTDSSVFYTETAYRYGSSQKKRVLLVSNGEPREYRIESDPSQVSYTDIVLGSHYTFPDASTLIIEYYYHGGGYSPTEWATLSDFILYSNKHYKAGVATDLMRGYIQQANSVMNFGSMSQQYGFLRFSKPDLIEKMDFSLVGLKNLSDQSFLLNPYLTYHLNDNSEIYLSAYWFSGSETSEFGLPNWNPEITVGTKWNMY